MRICFLSAFMSPFSTLAAAYFVKSAISYDP
nr:MAG TPA: hypothetical protein [Crassvirales sp.]